MSVWFAALKLVSEKPMGWKDITKDYLSFSRKERIGITVVILLIFFIWLSPKILHNSRPVETKVDTGWLSLAKDLQSKPSGMKNDETQDENSNALVYER